MRSSDDVIAFEGRAAIANVTQAADFLLDADMELPSAADRGGGGGRGNGGGAKGAAAGGGGRARSKWADPAYRAQMLSQRGGGRGRGGAGGGGRGRGQRGARKPRTCNKCGQLGHRWRSCPN